MSKDNPSNVISLENLLEYTHSKGFGYPIGEHWARIYSAVKRQTGASNWTHPKFRNPLILGGAIASPYHKEERFLTQIYWTYINGGYKTMQRLILRLKDEDWDGFDCASNSNPIPLNKIKQEYADWLGVNRYPERKPYTLDEIFPAERDARLRRRAERYEARLNRQEDNESTVSIGPGGLNTDEIRWDTQHVYGIDKVKNNQKW